MVSCCSACRVGWSLTPLQLCRVRSWGPAGSPGPRGDIPPSISLSLPPSMPAAAGDAVGSSCLLPPLLRSGEQVVLLRCGSLQKTLGWGEKKDCQKSHFFRFSSSPAWRGKGACPAHSLKTRLGNRLVSSGWWVQALSDKDKDMLSKYQLSFYSVWFYFSFLLWSYPSPPPLLQMWVGLQKKGWELPAVPLVESVQK